MTTEADLQMQVADYLCLQYPGVLFRSDFGSGTKLTPGQAKKQKRQNGGRRAWPDMFIAQKWLWMTADDLPQLSYDNSYPVRSFEYYAGDVDVSQAAGLFLELKKEGERLLAVPGHRRMHHYISKDGNEYKDQHTMEQADCLYELRRRGYCAEFAVGFDEAKKIIDEYLGGPSHGSAS